jgi:excinuclease UvrABC nuclease subunit
VTRCALYRHYDADNRLVYVGVSDVLSARDRQHASHSPWHDKVARTETQWCIDRAHALALERVAIAHEEPMHNVVYARPKAVSGGLSIKDAIALWPTRKALADDLLEPLENVHKWAQADRIPAWKHAAFLEAASLRGFDLTAEWLVKAHDERVPA